MPTNYDLEDLVKKLVGTMDSFTFSLLQYSSISGETGLIAGLDLDLDGFGLGFFSTTAISPVCTKNPKIGF